MKIQLPRRGLGILLTLALAMAVGPQAVLGIVANWQFNETSGTTAADSAGNGHTGTVSGATIANPGYDGTGRCLSFDGINDQVTVADAADLDFVDTIYIDARVNFATGATPGSSIYKILEKNSSGGGVPYGVRISSGKIGLWWNGAWIEGNSLTWNLNQWYRIEIAHDGSNVTFKRDGASAGTVGNTAQTIASTGVLYIGRGIAGSERWFKGKVDGVTVDVSADGGTRVANLWPYTSTSAWNRPIGDGATTAYPAALQNLGTAPTINQANWSVAMHFAAPTDVNVYVYHDLPWGGAGLPATVKMPANAKGALGSFAAFVDDKDAWEYTQDPLKFDGYCVIFDSNGWRAHELGKLLHPVRYNQTVNHGGGLYHIYDDDASSAYASAGNYFYATDINDSMRSLVNGTGWGSGPGAKAGSRASGSTKTAGIIRAWEVTAIAGGNSTAMRHVLACAIGWGQLYEGANQGACYQWPATSCDTDWQSYVPSGIPMGSLITIPKPGKPGGVDINTLGLTPAGLALAWTLQNFGAYVVDQGGGVKNDPNTKAFLLYAEQGANAGTVNSMRSDLDVLALYLRRVTNNSPTTVGGGGAYPPSLWPVPTPVTQ